MLAGIDVGSTGLKVSLFSLRGVRLHYAYREYSLEYLGDGRVVIDPAVWWEALCSCWRELGQQCDLRAIQGIGISHANAMVLTDGELHPLFKAIMQLDKRGSEMVPVLERELGNDAIFSVTGNNNAAGFVWGPTLKWLAVHEPEQFSRVRCLFNPSSYLVMRLTGAYCMDHTRAATTMLYNIHKGQWDAELCRYFSLVPDCLPPLHGSSDVVGRTTGDGPLPAGIPVTAGVMDTMAAMVGLGSGRQENALILGSVGRFVLPTQKLDRRFLNTVLPDRSALASMTPVNNAGISVRWARDLLMSGGAAGGYAEMDRLAAEKPVGSDGLMFFPYLTGASCPNWDASVRGAFLHMEAYHDSGHFSRAVMEGVGYALAEALQLFIRQVGAPSGRICCGGGGARSTLWTQILSDIFGRELVIPENLETETVGCAILAGRGAGLLRGDDVADWNRVVRTVSPRPDAHALYQPLLEHFIRVYPLLQQIQQLRNS
ncbi:MAG: hypothetical protein E7426_09350 [Ruminococcaceae bacterium]|nr:hypothetical protein [Oscillospiraceae bacterium]